MLIDIYMKFREDSMNGFQVIEQTRFCDRLTDLSSQDNLVEIISMSVESTF